MPSSSNRLSKRRQGGRKAPASGRRSYKRKRNENSSQNKYQNPITSPPNRDLPRSDPDSSRMVEVPGEESPKDKLASLHKLWKREDHLDSSEGNQLVTRQWQRCKDVGMAVFGFELQEGQVEAVSTLFYERRDLLLLAKTGFGKSLIFQILPFMFNPTGVVIILMPLKLLQAEQNSMINQIASGKAIALTGENNNKAVQQAIARQNYTHVFTSPEIALSKKFKANVLDDSRFASRLSLLAIDEIHLIEEWGKSFRPLYAEIEKVRKRIPPSVPLLGVSATLTKAARLQVLAKAGFRDEYKLMQTSLDRPEIEQIHRFMVHPKSSLLDLQFILPKTATQANAIQKTIIFVNTVAEIRPIIETIQAWMILLGYPAGSSTWIRPYHSAMSDWDKELIAKAFKTPGNENTECIILVATDAYGMGIDNPDIRLVIQWDLPLSFDSMIQRMGRAGRKGQQSWFVLLTPKWTQVKEPDEIEKILKKRQSIGLPQPKTTDQPSGAKPSPLAQEIDLDASDNDSVQDSGNEEPENEFHDQATEQLFDLISTEAESHSQSQKMKKQASKTNAQKRASLPDEIFDYIHVAKCRRLFSLAWYDDATYNNNQPLPSLYCNGPGCNSEEPECLKREPFVETLTIRYSETDREWMACRTAELTKWRKARSDELWREDGVVDTMPESLLMSDQCLARLAKEGESLDEKDKLDDFLQPWPDLNEFANEIFACIKRSSSHGDKEVIPTKVQRKEILKAARASKKAKFMDDPTIAGAARITAMRDEWLINNHKSNPGLKARLKKAKQAEQKQKAKAHKNRQKAQEQAQITDIRRLAIGNRQIGVYKDILSDPPAAPSSDPPGPAIPSHQTMATRESISNMLAMKNQRQSKKKELANRQTESIRRRKPSNARADSIASDHSGVSNASRKRQRSLTPPPMQMELIRPGKRRVKVTPNAVEHTSVARMRVARAIDKND